MRLERILWEGAERPTESVLRERLERERFDTLRWRDEAGADYRPHTHEHDESIWVIDGEIVFGAGGEEFRLGPGDRLMLPRGTVHAAHVGPGGATYLIGERRS